MRRSIISLGGLALVCALLALSAAVAVAVHDEGLFELDSNAVEDNGLPEDDWQNVYIGRSSAIATLFQTDNADPPADTTYFTGGGSKDVNDIDQWRHTASDQAPDKDELTNVYAASYVAEDDNLIVYFGADRYSSKGNSQIGFWFFQNPVTPLPDGTFQGVHQVGDILVLSDFVKGGRIPEVKVYEWVGSGGSDGSLDLIVDGVDCDDISPGDPHDVCATVNEKPEPSPWPYKPKSGASGMFPAGGFYEGGVKLNDGLLGRHVGCFSSFLVETRSSSSVTAELKDFAVGQIGECGVRIRITPEGAANQVGDEHPLTASVERKALGGGWEIEERSMSDAKAASRKTSSNP